MRATTRARELRRKQTNAERLLWRHLRDRSIAGFKFRRQHPIGPFFVDFACLRARFVVELDGGQHVEHARYDDVRTGFLERNGWRVSRFWDNDVLTQTDAVLNCIYDALTQHPSPHPSPRGRGEGAMRFDAGATRSGSLFAHAQEPSPAPSPAPPPSPPPRATEGTGRNASAAAPSPRPRGEGWGEGR